MTQIPPAVDPKQAPAPVVEKTAAPVPPTQTPAAKPLGVSPVPASQEDPKTVPLSALHEEREKRQQLQQELEALKRVAGNNVLFDINGNPVYQNQPQQPQATQQNQWAQELEKLWETDPRKAVQMEIYSAMSWRDQQDAVLDRQEFDVQNKYPDFGNYRNEIRGYIRSLPIEQRAQPGIIELAYYVVRGQKVDNIIAKTRQQIEQEYMQKLQSGEMAQGLPGGSVSSPSVPAGQIALTDEQKRAADAFGIPYQEYAKWIK